MESWCGPHPTPMAIPSDRGPRDCTLARHADDRALDVANILPAVIDAGRYDHHALIAFAQDELIDATERRRIRVVHRSKRCKTNRWPQTADRLWRGESPSANSARIGRRQVHLNDRHFGQTPIGAKYFGQMSVMVLYAATRHCRPAIGWNRSFPSAIVRDRTAAAAPKPSTVASNSGRRGSRVADLAMFVHAQTPSETAQLDALTSFHGSVSEALCATARVP